MHAYLERLRSVLSGDPEREWFNLCSLLQDCPQGEEEFVTKYVLPHIEDWPWYMKLQLIDFGADDPRQQIYDVPWVVPFHRPSSEGPERVANALEDTLNFIEEHHGFVGGLPYMMLAKLGDFKGGIRPLTEEHYLIDRDGILGEKGDQFVMVKHQGGFLPPARIRSAIREGLTSGAAKLTEKENHALLSGRYLDGTKFALYSTDEARREKVKNPLTGDFAIYLPFEKVKDEKSGMLTKVKFIEESDLALARTATVTYLEAYFDKFNWNDKLGNWHVYEENWFAKSQPQGRLLYLGDTNNGLDGNIHLGSDARFAGVSGKR